LKRKISIGTSGYTYSWNKGTTNKFRWYVDQGFNSVEINGSFYRFPTENWVNNWNANSQRGFDFSIKVHRAITHYSRLGDKAIQLWNRFKRPLKPIEERISYWLFQMPSTFTYNMENIEKIKNFENKAKLGNRAVLEFRDASWWSKAALKEINETGVAFCSVSAPSLPGKIVTINQTTYYRLHGITKWYNHVYSDGELDKILTKIKRERGKRKAIYLNNDHGMLQNGFYLLNHIE
jgi:uncharacterized protein YecE (DUF72 family)